MDQSNRRKVNNSKRSNSRKVSQELNGNVNNYNGSIKTENFRRRRDYYQKEEHDQERMVDGVPGYLPLRGQRLFAAVSDPAVCGYPVSLGYPYDPIPLSVGYPVYQPAPYPHRVSYKDQGVSPRRTKSRSNHEKVNQSKDAFQTVDEYTSLPPGNLQDIESDQQRRFSDPGLANNSGSEEDSLSNDGSSGSWVEESRVANQIEALVEDNKRLSNELKDTQLELQELKAEVASLVQVQSSCEPGFISDLVREVHESTKLREETLFARLKAFSESIQGSKTPSSSSVESKKGCSAECEETKEKLEKVSQEKDELNRRLYRLEEQMKTILTHNSRQEITKEELIGTREENIQLQRELKTALEARITAEANVARYERLFSSVSKKLPNGLVLDDKASAAASLESTESLASSVGSSSLHSPQVTMSGPVTDL